MRLEDSNNIQIQGLNLWGKLKGNLAQEVNAKKVNNLERSHYRAVKNWLTYYKPEPNASNFNQVSGYLEAFYHLYLVKNWEMMAEVISLKFEENKEQSLHGKILRWAYYPESLDIHNKLLEIAHEKDNLTGEKSALHNLGNTYHAFGYFNQAVECYQRALKIGEDINERNDKGIILLSLAAAYISSSNYLQGIDACLEAIEFTRQTGDRENEGKAIANLAAAFFYLSNHSQAIENYQRGFKD